MKLLLDEMCWPALANQLVLRGHDVIAATANASLTGMSDEDLFEAVQVAGRTLVTENVGDFIPIVQAHAETATPHRGLVLVPSSAFREIEPMSLPPWARWSRRSTLCSNRTRTRAEVPGSPGSFADHARQVSEQRFCLGEVGPDPSRCP